MVCEIRDQKGGIWDHSPRITSHRIKISSLEGSGISLYHFCGTHLSRDQNFSRFNQDQKFRYKNGISDEKTYPVTTSDNTSNINKIK